jgi:uncharacterized protein YbjT (DUF2867 family)
VILFLGTDSSATLDLGSVVRPACDVQGQRTHTFSERTPRDPTSWPLVVTRVLVTGVRGTTGVPVAQLLVRDGVEVLGGSSSPDAAVPDGVRPVRFSWDDPAGWTAAADGVDALYVVRPDREDAPELVGDLLEVLPLDTHVVLLSEWDADQIGPDGWAPRVERAVRSSGRSWTIVRPSWFMQVFTDPRYYRDPVVDGGELPFAAGGAGVAWIDARDIAAVAARALLEDGHSGRVHELSGPEALSLPRTAELLGRTVGRPVVHRDLTVAEAVEGSDGFDRDLSTVTFERVRSGVFAGVSDVVERVTGRPARSLEQFLADAGPDLRRA